MYMLQILVLYQPIILHNLHAQLWLQIHVGGSFYFQVEYDLENSSLDNLQILSCDRIEQSAVPLHAVWYPPVTKESFVLTANDQVGGIHIAQYSMVPVI